MKYKCECRGLVIVETDDVQEALSKVRNFVEEYKKHEGGYSEQMIKSLIADGYIHSKEEN